MTPLPLPSLLRWSALLLALGELFSCDRAPPCGEFPELPHEGMYMDIYPHDVVYITFDSIEIDCDLLTFRYHDDAGEEQIVTYQIEPED